MKIIQMNLSLFAIVGIIFLSIEYIWFIIQLQ